MLPRVCSLEHSGVFREVGRWLDEPSEGQDISEVDTDSSQAKTVSTRKVAVDARFIFSEASNSSGGIEFPVEILTQNKSNFR